MADPLPGQGVDWLMQSLCSAHLEEAERRAAREAEALRVAQAAEEEAFRLTPRRISWPCGV